MSVPLRHAFRQGPCIGTLLSVAMGTLWHRSSDTEVQVPGLERRRDLAPRSEDLVHDYIEWTGGTIDAYPGTIPAHLFPQWGFPLLAEALGEPSQSLDVVASTPALPTSSAPSLDEPTMATIDGTDDTLVYNADPPNDSSVAEDVPGDAAALRDASAASAASTAVKTETGVASSLLQLGPSRGR